MGNMLGTQCQEIILMDQTCRRCLFRLKAVAPPAVKPLDMVFMTHLGWLKGLSSLSLEWLRLLHLADQLVCFQSLPWPGSSPFLPSGLYECGWWTNSFRWPSIMSSFILSFKALHSSIEWPRLRWHRQRLKWSAFGRVLALLGMVKILMTKAWSMLWDL